MIFRDRSDAGVRLAAALRERGLRDAVVLALPRGGVPVAFEVAKALGAPLDLILVRKVGAPRQPELAMGAVVDGERMDLVLNDDVVETLGLSEQDVRAAAKREVEEIERRRRVYGDGRERARVAARTAIVVDDGIATGATVRAALRAVRRRQPGRLVLAVPVAPREALRSLRNEVDDVVCLSAPSPFGAVGAFYADFAQVSDDEVRRLLREAEAPAVGHG